MGTSSGHYNAGKLHEIIGATASNTTLVFDNHNYCGAHIAVDITAISGTLPVLTVYIEGHDTASGKWYTLLASAALSLTGLNLLTIYPGVATVANVAVAQVLPATWRIRYTISGTGAAVTATFGACMLK